MNRSFFIILFLPIFTACLPTTQDTMSQIQNAQPRVGTFTQLASMNHARADHASEAVNGKLYVFGGVDVGPTNLNSVEEYDPSTNSWSDKTNMTSDRQGMASAAVGTNVYLFGGYNDTGLGLNTAESYDTLTDSWMTISPLPVSAEFANARTVGSVIYVFPTAINGAGVPPQAYRYDPSLDSWTTLSAYSGDQTFGEPAVVGTKIYFVGRDPLLIYDTSNDSWSSVSGVTGAPLSNGGQGAVVLNAVIFAFDAMFEDNGGASIWVSGLQQFSLTQPIASQTDYVPDVTTLCRAAVWNGSAYITGGAEYDYTVTANLYRFDY